MVVKDVSGQDLDGLPFAVPSGYLYHRKDQELIQVLVDHANDTDLKLDECRTTLADQQIPEFFNTFTGKVVIGAVGLAMGAGGTILAVKYLQK